MLAPELADLDLTALKVFPLPSTVLFPGTVLPLHVFEPRYQALVTDALAGDRVFAAVMLKHAEEADQDQPGLHEVACAGRILHVDELADGRFNLLLQGMGRVRLVEELPLHQGYRRFAAEAIPEPDAQALEHAGLALARLQSCILGLRSFAQEHDPQLIEVLSCTPNPAQLANILGAAVLPNPQLQQRVLQTEDFSERVDLLVEGLAEILVHTADPGPRVVLN